VEVPVRDLERDPDEKERAGDEERAARPQRLPTLPHSDRDCGDDDRDHREVGQIRVRRRRAHVDAEPGLVLHVQEQGRNRSGHDERARRHRDERQPPLQPALR
jgi:hypothetical protein